MKPRPQKNDPAFLAAVCMKGCALVSAALLVSALLFFLRAGDGLQRYIFSKWSSSLILYAAVCLLEGLAAVFLVRRYSE